MIVVLHAGPDPDFAGGMAAAIKVLVAERLGCDAASALPTWRPAAVVATLRLWLVALWRVIRTPRAVVVHVHLAERGSFLREGSVLWMAALLGHPTVATVHAAEYAAFARNRPHVVRAVLGRADRVIALYRDNERELTGLLDGDQVVQAPNPTPPQRSRPIEETGRVILFGGEVSLRKGVDVLVAAWPHVQAVHGDARCLIVGRPGDYTVPETPGIEVRPPVGADEMRSLIAASRVVVLPSRAEAMPMILTEAIAAGRPFVASRVGGIAELAVSEEQLCAPEDVAGLAAALSALLSAPSTARRIGDAGRELWEQTRSPRALEHFYRRIYGEAISASARRPR